MSVQIPGQDNPLSTFEVRSSSYNSYKTLKGQLELVERRFGGLRHVPLRLQIWPTYAQGKAGAVTEQQALELVHDDEGQETHRIEARSDLTS